MAGIRLGSWESARARPVSPAQASLLRSWPTPELRIPNAAAQTRIVSKARIRLDSGKSVRSFKGIICADISESCQALSDCSVDPGFDVARRDPRFSSGSALWPSHDGIRRMRRTNLTIRPCRKTYGRHQDSKRTRLIHRPCGDIAPPGRRNSVFSYRYCAQLRHDMMSVTSVH
jgi:hypothetical protein